MQHPLREEDVLSAGFLFYSSPPNTSEFYFLLGMESSNKKWSDFGGCRQDQESVIDCAVREMTEESMGLVGTNDEALQFNIFQNPEYMSDVKQELRDCNYFVRVDVDITGEIPQHSFNSTKWRVCYVKRIPWQPELPQTFAVLQKHARVFRKLVTAQSRLQYWQTLPRHLAKHPCFELTFSEPIDSNQTIIVVDVNVKREWLEKSQMAWWSASRIRSVLRNHGRYRHHWFRIGILSTLSTALHQLVHVQQTLEQQQNLEQQTLELQQNLEKKPLEQQPLEQQPLEQQTLEHQQQQQEQN